LGHKVHPIGFRLGVIKGWQSRWFAERTYKDLLAEDLQLRKVIRKELASAGVSRIEIERPAARQVSVTIHTAKPGIVIGKSGQKVEDLRQQLETDAYLVAKSIAEQLEKRISFRRAMKQAVQKAMRSGAKGIKVVVGGRLGGAEIARSEKEVDGKVPLQTLRADIDFDIAEAHTTFGVIGVKVWIYRGDVLPDKRRIEIAAPPEPVPLTPGVSGGREERRSERPRRERGPGGPRGERGSFGGPRGDRPPRPTGDRPPRPAGERPPRGEGAPVGDRPPRPASERFPRGPRPDRPPRPPVTEQSTPPAPVESSPAENPPEPAPPRPEEEPGS
jgi:small subunit ribosomal protein S3